MLIFVAQLYRLNVSCNHVLRVITTKRRTALQGTKEEAQSAGQLSGEKMSMKKFGRTFTGAISIA
jgi:hypothetical protein